MKVFPHGTVQGCAFHLAQAWNRRRDKLGMRRFFKSAIGVPESLEVERTSGRQISPKPTTDTKQETTTDKKRQGEEPNSYFESAEYEGDHPTLTKLILVLRDLDGEA
ncbi:hypothetical protein Y032_0047g1500 [Ancylostoma ceylanicum]|uniref:MULE transposase domain-containing protein n=1 Tax=Ancylostoma ceylanicum TaxID=53326 RepID=A0A016UAY8_9BILA|nr:hypothetical protein Y032_0047g1500 [Ancylostoma ceylanicum]